MEATESMAIQTPQGCSGAPTLSVLPASLSGHALCHLLRLAQLSLPATSMPFHGAVGPWGCSPPLETSCLALVTCPQGPRQGNLQFGVMGGTSLPLASAMYSAFFLKSHPAPWALTFGTERFTSHAGNFGMQPGHALPQSVQWGPCLLPLEWEEDREKGKMGKKNKYLKIKLSPQAILFSHNGLMC